jgi:hypothetical protein
MLDNVSARALAVLVLLAAGPAWGHEGHGIASASGWLHHLTEPIHVLPALILVVLALGLAVGGLRLARSRSRS